MEERQLKRPCFQCACCFSSMAKVAGRSRVASGTEGNGGSDDCSSMHLSSVFFHFLQAFRWPVFFWGLFQLGDRKSKISHQDSRNQRQIDSSSVVAVVLTGNILFLQADEGKTEETVLFPDARMLHFYTPSLKGALVFTTHCSIFQ